MGCCKDATAGCRIQASASHEIPDGTDVDQRKRIRAERSFSHLLISVFYSEICHVDAPDRFHETPHLYALSLSAAQGRLHHAVVLSQHPGSVDELDVVSGGTGEVVCAQTVSFNWLRSSSGVIDVEDHVSFTHIKVPRNDRRYFCNLYQHLETNQVIIS